MQKNFNLIRTEHQNFKHHRVIFISFAVFLIFMNLLLVQSAHAKNLGVWGSLFPIEEQDIREFIYQRLNEMEQKGELARLKEKFIQNVKKHILRPAPVFGLTTTDSPKIFYYDPTYILHKDIEDHLGNVIAKKGTIINPLDTITLNGVLFFLDADDKRQINWAREFAKKYDYIRYILVKGNIREAGKSLNDRVYFDQYGFLTRKLNIHHVPCLVKQADNKDKKGEKLQIQEFALENDTNNKKDKNNKND